MGIKYVVSILAIAATLGLAVAKCDNSNYCHAESEICNTLEVPEIQAKEWYQYDPQIEQVVETEPLELEHLEGVVMLEFFGYWCGYCRKQSPDLE